MSSKESDLSREGITIGTICEYHRLEHKPWVLVVGMPGTIEEYTADGWEPTPADAWDEYDPDTVVLQFAIVESIPDSMIALLEGEDLEGHRRIAQRIRTDEEIDCHVGPRPLFNPLGPISKESQSSLEVDTHAE